MNPIVHVGGLFKCRTLASAALLIYLPLCWADEAKNDWSPIVRLERIEENFDGGSTSFFLKTKSGLIIVWLMDQPFLKEHQMENPEIQRMFYVQSGKSVLIEQGGPEEKALEKLLLDFAKTLESANTTRLKIDQLVAILNNRRVPAVSKSFWYQ
jgi:hypothetical protein